MPEKKVNWSEPARKQYLAVIEYILSDSVQNAESFEAKLFSKLRQVSEFPIASPLDKYKVNNDGRFRAFILFDYRVSYEVQLNAIKILRFRHMKRKVKYY